MATATEDRRKELEAEAGPAVGEMPEPERQLPSDPDDAIIVDGTTQLALFDAGGKQPTRGTIKFTGGKVRIAQGQAFRKGDTIRFAGEAVVNLVALKDEHDASTGIVVDCEQRHEARIIDLEIESAG